MRLMKMIVVFLTVIVIYQGRIMQKQDKGLDSLEGAVNHCIEQVVITSEAAVEYFDKLQECRMFSDACHAAYKECSDR